MILTIVIAFFSLLGLLVLHEFGHFWVARRFGVKVEEFGVGLPPRIFGKKIGETIYSLNLIPFGAFVKLPGEIEKNSDPWSFGNQPVQKRALIVLAGVLSFWLMAIIIFSVVFGLGAPTAITDEEKNAVNPKVQIIAVSAESPAQLAGVKPGDTILKFSKVKEVQEFTELNKGQEIIFSVQRGKEVLDVKITPRVSPPANEGPLGVALARVGLKSYPWWQAPGQGFRATGELTLAVFKGYFKILADVSRGQPTGAQLTGPIGIFNLLGQASSLGANYFLNLLGTIVIYLAIFNILPIPAVDGGKIMFLAIEWVRKKPISPKIEQKITAAFFAALIGLMVWVSIKDVSRIF